VGRLGPDAGRGAGLSIVRRWSLPARRKVPVTLKMRTGWCERPQCGHAGPRGRVGRRADAHRAWPHARAGLPGAAEYDTIAAVKAAVRYRWWPTATLPPEPRRARCWPRLALMRVMIGRAAQGGPGFSARSRTTWTPAKPWRRRWWRSAPPVAGHLQDHYALYGEYTGVRSARKHIGWYVRQRCRAATPSPTHQHSGGQRLPSGRRWPITSMQLADR
jgi:tRNA-dihydrouridine synthase B